MSIPETDSAPKAFTAKEATTAESIPPESPTTTLLFPALFIKCLRVLTKLSWRMSGVVFVSILEYEASAY
ncbi:hypothetical protein SDC9_143051 [bioreactor metagenome]|uniref:Uncharacterized protein n=1 Tax=bioreactor metagenome TaxID=1076179 RepID=A0A645E2Z0_9ZZZZ